jgi:F0F1-type ATP synthase assembly protein I
MATTHGNSAGHGARHDEHDGLDAKYLRIVAIWSLVPGYTIAAGILGYFLDQWFGTWPFIFTGCLVIALVLAVRDMIRLRKEIME